MGRVWGMATSADVSSTLRVLRGGPRAGISPPSEKEVREVVKADRDGYIRSLKGLLQKLAQSQLTAPERNIAAQYADFSASWLNTRRDDASRFYAGYLGAYVAAVDVGLTELDWQNPTQASHLADDLGQLLPEYETPEGLAWRIVLAQIQSLFSRDAAADTFRAARNHDAASLISSFYWDMGAFTYYSQDYVAQSRPTVSSLSELSTWSSDTTPASDHAIVLSMDESFFRTFGPMVLFNAQQVRNVDFVILLCTETGTAQQLIEEAKKYVSGLSSLNKQPAPKNVHVHVTPEPSWAENPKTFYASIRFLALPELLGHYETVYCMDADLFMMHNPQRFLEGSWPVAMNAYMNKSLLSVSPWRRFMAGNVVVTKAAANSSALQHLVEYLAVGLTQQFSWMLDQNALSYVADLSSEDEFGALDRVRPGATARFMATWEQNYRRATR